MKDALKGTPEHKLEQPSNMVNVRIDSNTGLLAQPNQKDAIFEIFREKHVPKERVKTHAVTNDEDFTDQEIF